MPFLPSISAQVFEAAKADDAALYELLTAPLHVGLYKAGSFDFLDELNDAQQLLLCFDYLRNQVLQGGFIQLLHNGYVGLLPEMPRQLEAVKNDEMAALIDEVLKHYVAHHETLEAELSPEAFAKLYVSLPAFIPLDERFEKLQPETMHKLMEFAREKPELFAAITVA